MGACGVLLLAAAWCGQRGFDWTTGFAREAPLLSLTLAIRDVINQTIEIGNQLLSFQQGSLHKQRGAVMPGQTSSQDTWERILESAETLFARQGFSGTSTRQIAAEAGISIQTLQYHCGGKKNLYRAVLERVLIPVTDMVARYVEKMLEQDLSDIQVFEQSVARIVDELFDLLQANPNYAPLLYRQWLVHDPDLRSVEWESPIPLLRRWTEETEAQLGEEGLRGTNVFLVVVSMAIMHWGLFVQPSFLAQYMGIDTASPEFLRIMKDHAWEMTVRMWQQRQSSSPSPFRKKKARTTKKKSPTQKKRK